MTITGGCLCGAIRFSAEGLPRRITHCHCDTCRRAVGAVVATFATFERRFVTWRGEPARYESSEKAWREFCPACGTSLSFNYRPSAARVFISVGTFDDPSVMAAGFHDFRHNKIPWLSVDEHLPYSPH
ncbi:MAG: GFA family protein [Rhodospirillales bacterium]|nr:GFA family protein [Rhodospirillales bacterium]